MAAETPSFPGISSFYDWPVRDVPIRILNTAYTLQLYGGYPGFHHGLDLQAPAGTSVYSPVGGVVTMGYYYPRYRGPYTFEIAIHAPDGFVWQFHHLDPASIPQELKKTAKNGEPISAGALLGEIWDASKMGIPPHVHVNAISPQGYYQEPMRYFPPVADQEPPIIRGLYIVDGRNNVVGIGSTALKPGPYVLVIDAADQIPLSPLAQSIYGLNVSGKIVDQKGRVRTWNLVSRRFSVLPEKSFLDGVEKVYQLEPITLPNGTRLDNQLDPNQPRRFLYRVPLGSFARSPGDVHVLLSVVVSDFAGNKTRREISFSVSNR